MLNIVRAHSKRGSQTKKTKFELKGGTRYNNKNYSLTISTIKDQKSINCLRLKSLDLPIFTNTYPYHPYIM